MAKNKNKNKGNNMVENNDFVPETEQVISEDKIEGDEQQEPEVKDTGVEQTEEVKDTQEETKASEADVPDAVIQEDTTESKEDGVEEKQEEPEEVLPVKNYTFSLTEAIDFSKSNSTKDLLEKLLSEGHLDIKLFGAELTDVINAYNKKSELESNNGNRKLFNLLVRTLKIENAAEFKFKFDVLNRVFLEDENFNPVTLLNCTLWTKSEKDIATFAQLATIIEDLADRATRTENKKRIANLSNLNLDNKSLENIKNYYKL